MSIKPVARWPVARPVNEGQIQLPGCSHGRHISFFFFYLMYSDSLNENCCSVLPCAANVGSTWQICAWAAFCV